MSAASLELLRALSDVRSALAQSELLHAFIDALPVLAWGRVRATTDLDLVVSASPESFAPLDSALRARGFSAGKNVGPAEPTDPLPDIAVYWSSTQPAVRLDVFIAKTSFEQAVLDSALETEVLGSMLRLASPEASIIYKLLASRARDIADVEWIFENRILGGHPLDWPFLERWAAEWGIEDRLAPYKEKRRAR
ncbi:MAG: hypothetical protein HYZ28_07320 [Myxococcales bacterium]|nr:hypothetical protein [Myxococcales bacterium]